MSLIYDECRIPYKWLIFDVEIHCTHPLTSAMLSVGQYSFQLGASLNSPACINRGDGISNLILVTALGFVRSKFREYAEKKACLTLALGFPVTGCQ
jgi:hypothetical protein